MDLILNDALLQLQGYGTLVSLSYYTGFTLLVSWCCWGAVAASVGLQLLLLCWVLVDALLIAPAIGFANSELALVVDCLAIVFWILLSVGSKFAAVTSEL